MEQRERQRRRGRTPSSPGAASPPNPCRSNRASPAASASATVSRRMWMLSASSRSRWVSAGIGRLMPFKGIIGKWAIYSAARMEACCVQAFDDRRRVLTGGAAAAQAPQQALRTDVVKTVNANFDQGDVNNDGFLSRNEIANMTGKAAAGGRRQDGAGIRSRWTRTRTGRSASQSPSPSPWPDFPETRSPWSGSILNKDGKAQRGRVPHADRSPPSTAPMPNKDGKATLDEAKKVSSAA